jgi:beta-fructofuranosidase
LRNEKTEQGYQFKFPVAQHRYLFEGTPNWPWFTNMNIGLERPLTLEPGRVYHMQLVVDDTIATLYVDGVALNARMYTRPGDDISMFVTDGSLSISDAVIRRGLKEGAKMA